MDERPPSVHRRYFLTAAGTTGLAGLAGCSALTESNAESQPDPETDEQAPGTEDSELGTKQPDQLVENYYESLIEQQALRMEMRHSAVSGRSQLENLETRTVEQSLSPDAFHEYVHLPRETVEEILADADTAIVEASFEIQRTDERSEETVQLALATESGNWRIVDEDASRDSSSGEASDESDEETIEPDPAMPREAHAYLTTHDANSYDGTLADRTGEETVTISVGAGNQAFSFDPPAVRVDAGTEIVWEWTGDGGAHNVATTEAPESFQSGDPVLEEGLTFSATVEEAGNYFYHCEPHHATGMHGAVIVE